MKVVASIALGSLVAGWCSLVVAEDSTEKMLAEMKKCAVCKCMAEKPELLKNMVWETHKIDNGMLCVTTVPKEMKKEFDALNEQMLKAVEQVQADAKEGKSVELCGFCTSMGELMKLNAKQHDIKTKTGSVHLCTSDDPDVVKKIHELADKATKMQESMEHSEHTASLK